MGYIHCCGGLRKTRSFALSPANGFVICELDILSCCPVCGHYVIQITRIDNNNNLSTVRKENLKAKKLFEKLKNKIIYEKRIPSLSTKRYGTFYLNYNEYGIKKRCYSNFSSLKLGIT